MKKHFAMLLMLFVSTLIIVACNNISSSTNKSITGIDSENSYCVIDNGDHGEESSTKANYEFIITKSFSSTGNIASWTETQYDSLGNRVKNSYFSSDNSFSGWNRFEYDNLGNCSLAVFYNSDNSIEEWIYGRYYSKDSLAEFSCFDSKGILIEHSEFDTNGHLRKELKYASDGNRKLVSGHVYRYDADGNKISEIILDEYGNVREWTDYLYKNSNLEPSYSKYDSYGTRISRSNYLFDDQGRVEYLFVYDSQNNVKEYTEWIYDNSNLKEKIFYGGNEERHTEYDSSGNVVRVTLYNNQGVLWFQTDNSFDSNSNLIRSVTVNKYKERTIQEWDSAGNQLKEIKYKKDGSIFEGYEYIYDDTNRMIKKTTFDSAGNISNYEEIEYDQSGNRVKKSHYDSGGNFTGWTIEEYHDFLYISSPANVLSDNLFGILVSELSGDNHSKNLITLLNYDSKGNIVSGFVSDIGSSGNIVKVTNYTDGEISSWIEYEYYYKGDYLSKNPFSKGDSEFSKAKMSVTFTDDIEGLYNHEYDYYTYYRIPIVNIDGKNLEDVNKKMRDDVIHISNNNQCLTSNSCYIGNEVISICLKFSYEGYYSYEIYNISVESGRFIDSSELIKIRGLTDSQFFDIVTESYDKYWLIISKDLSGDILDEYNKRHQENYKFISYKQITPFISSEGHLCFVSRNMFTSGVFECEDVVFDTTTGNFT